MSMFTPDQAFRLSEARLRLLRGVELAIREDGYHKSSEGHMQVSYLFPNFFGDEDAPWWEVSIYAYVLGPERNYSFRGRTLDECIVQFEAWLEKHAGPIEFQAFCQHVERQQHASDCAIHNEPAQANGPCDCGFEP